MTSTDDSDYFLDMGTAAVGRVLADYHRRSIAEAAWPDTDVDVPYGDRSAERFSIAWPADPAGTRLVVIFYHGGWWKAGNKEDRLFLASALRREGIALASVGYPLAPETPLRDIAPCALRAARAVAAHVCQRSSRDCRVVLCGNSAGAHLASHVAGRLHRAPEPGDPALAGLCAVSGLYDLAPLRASFANDWLKLSSTDVDDLGPVNLLPSPALEVLLAVGEREPAGFGRQMRWYGERLAAQGNRVTEMSLPGHDHFTAIGEIGRPGSAVFEWLLQRGAARP